MSKCSAIPLNGLLSYSKFLYHQCVVSIQVLRKYWVTHPIGDSKQRLQVLLSDCLDSLNI